MVCAALNAAKIAGVRIAEVLGITTVVASIVLSILFNGKAGAKEFLLSVRSIDEVADGGMPQITEVSTSEAVLVFQSNQPLACSIVFGETPEFGLVATDRDMDGGAHTDHHPAMTGLKPAASCVGGPIFAMKKSGQW